jgi:hypothetical protein
MRRKNSQYGLRRRKSPTPRCGAGTCHAQEYVADQEQIEEALALDLQQMKIRLQGTPGTTHIPLPLRQYYILLCRIHLL